MKVSLFLTEMGLFCLQAILSSLDIISEKSNFFFFFSDEGLSAIHLWMRFLPAPEHFVLICILGDEDI